MITKLGNNLLNTDFTKEAKSWGTVLTKDLISPIKTVKKIFFRGGPLVRGILRYGVTPLVKAPIMGASAVMSGIGKASVKSPTFALGAVLPAGVALHEFPANVKKDYLHARPEFDITHSGFAKIKYNTPEAKEFANNYNIYY